MKNLSLNTDVIELLKVKLLTFNLLKILRWKEVCNNLPSNFEIFDIPMVVNSLNPSTR